MKSSPLTIGQVAAHFDLPTRVLRHWESEGLLSPARVAGARRRYTRDDLYRVASILRAKQAGFPLSDIREMLTAGSPPERQRVLHRHHAELRSRMANLQAAMALLEGAISCTHEDFATCPRYQAQLEEMVGSVSVPRRESVA
ncbi:MAG: MerR family transcriptional regulator [Actinophytocola sp.]|uniref:MerR family transcriptional regulator n=1 Tax=Actinophytocola sp. TaxID=1872138 RepID=UPI0013229135|nr:MerR family transcriptional regulator [Actinophytocola sp.]MPZ81440.1 MerR family transcriptional regulator [Actinophytocola sp.]